MLEELEPLDDEPPAAQSPPAPFSGRFAAASEHADFGARMAEAHLDPLPGLQLRPALQRAVAAAQAAHGDDFDVQVRMLDPALIGQVRRVFGAV